MESKKLGSIDSEIRSTPCLGDAVKMELYEVPEKGLVVTYVVYADGSVVWSADRVIQTIGDDNKIQDSAGYYMEKALELASELDAASSPAR